MARRSTSGGRSWRHPAYSVLFWIFAVLGIPIMIIAWLMLPLASLEEVTEGAKAKAAGERATSMTILFGVTPVIVAHLVGLASLGTVTALGRVHSRSRVTYPIIAVATASIIGLVVILIVTRDQLIVPPIRYTP